MINITVTEVGGKLIGEIVSDSIVLANEDDGLDILGECKGLGINGLVMHEHNIAPAFFELRTRLAGEVLQKFTQYHVRLAVVMGFRNLESKSLRDFIGESNRMGNIIFTDSAEEAMGRLAR